MASNEKEIVHAGVDLPTDDSSSSDGQDGRDMARMGKQQEFSRGFNWISSVGLTSCAMGT